jgi:hypothetical protein
VLICIDNPTPDTPYWRGSEVRPGGHFTPLDVCVIEDLPAPARESGPEPLRWSKRCR